MGLTALLALIYFLTTTPGLVTHDWEASADEAAKKARREQLDILREALGIERAAPEVAEETLPPHLRPSGTWNLL
jgi:hypothetical protein